MSTAGPIHVTPEQVAAISAGNGFAHAEDPATHRVYLLVEQQQAPTLPDEYFRQELVDGVAEADRRECRPWNVDDLKADLMRRLCRVCSFGDSRCRSPATI
ncbi:MAG: hypothetical protein AB7G28_21915 [Pirellulales bacterium]